MTLITSPAFIVMKAASEFRDKTTAPNQLWQTDFTYLKVIGWGWFYLSTFLDDYSRYIITWKLCTGMAASDVQDTFDQALAETGLDQANVVHRPRLLSDNGPCYVSGELAAYLRRSKACRIHAVHRIILKPKARLSAGTKHSRTASCWRTTSCQEILKPDRGLRWSLQSSALPRELEQL